MKLVSLNIWGGGFAYTPLVEFIKEHADSTDIFCFQEMTWAADKNPQPKAAESVDLFGDFERLLPEHTGLMSVTQEGWHWRPQTGARTGNAVFVRKALPVADYGEVFILGEKNGLNFDEGLAGNWSSMPRALQFVQLAEPQFTVFNYHGYWHFSGKGDLPERLEQSDKILSFMKKFEGKKVLCGDFNLDMDTESVRAFEAAGFRNLVRESGVATTRNTTHYPKHKEMPFADYTFVSPDVEVQHFEVPHSPASDHLPMILQFE